MYRCRAEDAALDDKIKNWLSKEYSVDFGEDEMYDYGGEIRKQISKYKIDAAERL